MRLELDGNGRVLVGGTTTSADFPGQSRSGRENADAFISSWRLSDTASHHSVVFGGSSEEKLTGIALDGKGGVFAVGYTKSDDFPTHDPVQPSLRGVSDLFLTRLQVSSLAISFSTYLGGSGDDSGWGGGSRRTRCSSRSRNHRFPGPAGQRRRLSADGSGRVRFVCRKA